MGVRGSPCFRRVRKDDGTFSGSCIVAFLKGKGVVAFFVSSSLEGLDLLDKCKITIRWVKRSSNGSLGSVTGII